MLAARRLVLNLLTQIKVKTSDLMDFQRAGRQCSGCLFLFLSLNNKVWLCLKKYIPRHLDTLFIYLFLLPGMFQLQVPILSCFNAQNDDLTESPTIQPLQKLFYICKVEVMLLYSWNTILSLCRTKCCSCCTAEWYSARRIPQYSHTQNTTEHP